MRTILKYLIITSILVLTNNKLFACNRSTATLNSETNNGNGTYTYVVNLCSEFNGMETYATSFSFAFNGVTSVSSALPNTVTTSGGDVYNKNITGITVRYSTSGYPPLHSSSSSTFCNTYTFVTVGKATTITVITNIPASSSYANCTKILTPPTCSTPAAPTVSNVTYCQNATGAVPLSATASGGTLNWYGTNATGGTASASAPTPGTATTSSYYVSQTVAGCESPRAKIDVTITTPTTPTFTPITAICSGGSITLPPASTNGITGTWSPAVNNAATTTYTFNPTAGQCASTTTLAVTVNTPTTPAFTQVAAVCSGGTITLPTSSNNSINGTWSPVINNTATTTYIFTPTAGQCASTATMTVTVNTPTTPTFTTIPTICSGGTINLQTTSLNNVVGTWSPATNNTATTNYTFTPNAGQCSNTATLTVNVTSPITPTFTQVAAICSGGTITLPPTSTNAISGTWTPALNNTATTTYTFTPTGCANTATMTVTVNTPITPTFNQVAPICSGGSFTLPSPSTNSITGTWSPSNNTTATTNYTFTPGAGQCATTATMSVTVNPILTPNVSCGTLTTTSVDFNWTSVAGAAGYNLSYTINGGASTSAGSIVAGTTTYSQTGLSSGNIVILTVTPTGAGCFAAGTTNCTASNCIPPTITQPTSQTVCAGNTATFTVTGSGTANGYQWVENTGSGWNIVSNGGVYSGATTNTLTITGATVVMNTYQYRCVVKEATSTCPTTSNAVTLTVDPTNIGGSITSDNTICSGLTSGLLTLVGNTGAITKWQSSVSPFSTWNDIANTATTYSSGVLNQTTQFRAVIQSGSCPAVNSAPATITVNNSQSLNLVCGGNATMTSVDFAWTDLSDETSYNYSYTINGAGAPITGSLPAGTTSHNITGLSVGQTINFTLTAVGASCTTSETFNCSTQNCPTPTVDAITDLVICSGQNIPLIAFNSPQGTAPAITFNWDNTNTNIGLALSGSGSSITSYTAPSVITQQIGTISIKASDGICTGPSTTFRITINPLPNVTSVTGGTTYCTGATVANIIANVTGSANWTINYTQDGNPKIATGTSSPIVLGNTAGVYEVTGVQDNVCSNTATGTQTITLNTLPTVTSVTGGATYCTGATISNIVANVTGSANWTVNYTFNGNAQTATGTTSPITIGNTPGIYIVTGVTDNTTCSNSATGTQTITVNSLPTIVSLTGGGTYCANAIAGNVTAIVTGASPYTVNYTLNGAANTATGANSNITLNNVAGTYIVTSITDNNNCTNTATGSQTITINTIPTITNITGGAVYCTGATVANILVDVTGAPNWTIDYTLNGVANTTTGSTSPISLGNNPGIYAVTSISDNNCINSTVAGTQTITINQLPTVSQVAGGGTYCTGANPNNINVTTTGTSPWTINYTLNGNPLTVNGAISPISLGNTAGTYVITSISDALCNNTASGTQTITLTNLPTITSVTGGATYCIGDAIQPIEVDVTGTPNWTINYTLNGNAQVTTGSTSPIVLGTTAGTYIVTSISDAACTNTANGTQTITQNPLPTVTTLTGGNTYCANQTVSNIEAAVTGTSPWTINYTLNGVPVTANGAISPIVLGNTAGTYTITSITDANCTNSSVGVLPQTIVVNPLPTVTNVSGGNNYCPGNIVAPINVVVTGSPNWTINYTLNGASLNITNASSPISLGNTAGNYVITGISDANCSNTAFGSQSIIINTAPSFVPSYNGPICQNKALILNANFPNANSYNWTGPNNFTDNSENPVINNAQPSRSGVYTLRLIDQNNCSSSINLSVTVNTEDVVVIQSVTPICSNEKSINLAATPAGGTWSGNGVTINGVFQPNKTLIGNNIITYTSSGICPDIDVVTINVKPLPKIDFIAIDSVCTDEFFTIQDISISDLNPVKWIFEDNATSNILNETIHSYTTSGSKTISLIGTDVTSQCTDTLTKIDYIQVMARPNASFSYLPETPTIFTPVVNFNNLSTDASSYVWNFGDNSKTSMVNPIHTYDGNPQEYFVRLTAWNSLPSCSDDTIVTLNIYDEIFYYVPNSFTPNGDELNNIFKPILSGAVSSEGYTLYIFNRWGELLFESHNKDVGWDGTYGNKRSIPDTYIWKLEFKYEPTLKKYAFHGHVNLLD